MNLKNLYLNLSNKNKNLIPQVLTVLLLVLVIIYFAINAQNNMGNRGISFGFGFLSQESSFDITFSLIDLTQVFRMTSSHHQTKKLIKANLISNLLKYKL